MDTIDGNRMDDGAVTRPKKTCAKALRYWSDCKDMKDVRRLLNKIRAPRYDRLGRRRPKP